VIRLRTILPTDATDPIVAATAERTEAILISHDGDFKQIAPRVPMGSRARFRKLSRIHIACKKTKAHERLAAAMALLEFEWHAAQSRNDKRLHLIIQANLIKTVR
jgi:predicted nuclease of predicted toxin-antitoxin system